MIAIKDLKFVLVWGDILTEVHFTRVKTSGVPFWVIPWYASYLLVSAKGVPLTKSLIVSGCVSRVLCVVSPHRSSRWRLLFWLDYRGVFCQGTSLECDLSSLTWWAVLLSDLPCCFPFPTEYTTEVGDVIGPWLLKWRRCCLKAFRIDLCLIYVPFPCFQHTIHVTYILNYIYIWANVGNVISFSASQLVIIYLIVSSCLRMHCIVFISSTEKGGDGWFNDCPPPRNQRFFLTIVSRLLETRMDAVKNHSSTVLLSAKN